MLPVSRTIVPHAIGVQRNYDLLPPVSTGTLLVGYSVAY